MSQLPGSSVEAPPEGNRKRVVPLSPVNEFPCSSPSKLPVPGRAGFISLTHSPRRAQLPISCLLFLLACQEQSLSVFRKVFLYVLLLDPYCAVSAWEGQGLTSLLVSSEDKTVFFNAPTPSILWCQHFLKEATGLHFPFALGFCGKQHSMETLIVLSSALGFLPKEEKQGSQVIIRACVTFLTWSLGETWPWEGKGRAGGGRWKE